MKNMFYNYEHNIDCKEYPANIFIDTKKPMMTNSSVKKLYNIKGEEIGVTAKHDSNFYLYFNFYSEHESVEELHYTLQDYEIYLDILDYEYNVIMTLPTELNPYKNEVRVKIDTNSSLVYGNYKLHLYIKNNEEIYTLFSERDAILNID